MKWGRPISTGMSIRVPNRIALPFCVIEYRFKHRPRIGLLEEKWAATCLSVTGVLSVVYHANFRSAQDCAHVCKSRTRLTDKTEELPGRHQNFFSHTAF